MIALPLRTAHHFGWPQTNGLHVRAGRKTDERPSDAQSFRWTNKPKPDVATSMLWPKTSTSTPTPEH